MLRNYLAIAARNLGGRRRDPDEPMPVIGVVRDFHYEDMRQTVGPALLAGIMPGSRHDGFSQILFRLDDRDLPAALEEVEALWERVLPEHELQDRPVFLDEPFEWQYRAEQRVAIRHEVDERLRPRHLLHGFREGWRTRLHSLQLPAGSVLSAQGPLFGAALALFRAPCPGPVPGSPG